MAGPSEANPGDTLVYTLSYEVVSNEGTSVILSYPNAVTYVSSTLISGQGQASSEPGSTAGAQVRWVLSLGGGILEIRLRVPDDAVPGTFAVGAYEPGTMTTQSNPVTTTVVER